MAASVGKSCPPLQGRGGSVSRLMVTPRVSGLERSQEKSLEQHFPETVCPSTSSASFSRLPSPAAAAGPLTRPSPNGNSSQHNGNDAALSKPKPFLTLPGRSHPMFSINNRYDRCLYFEHWIHHPPNVSARTGNGRTKTWLVFVFWSIKTKYWLVSFQVLTWKETCQNLSVWQKLLKV